MVDVAGEAVDENERTGFGSDVDVGGGAGGWNGLIDNVVVAIVYEATKSQGVSYRPED